MENKSIFIYLNRFLSVMGERYSVVLTDTENVFIDFECGFCMQAQSFNFIVVFFSFDLIRINVVHYWKQGTFDGGEMMRLMLIMHLMNEKSFPKFDCSINFHHQQ